MRPHEATSRVRIHRGQSAPAGRAHRDRGGDRRRSGEDAAAARRRDARWPTSDLRQAEIPAPRGFAIQLRINVESMGADGSCEAAGGTITAFEAPSGPGVRVDTFAYAGYTTNPSFDSLLAKLIAHSPSPDFADAVAKAYRALCEFRIEGVATNIGISAGAAAASRFRRASRPHPLRRGSNRGAGRPQSDAASAAVLRSIVSQPGGDCTRARPARRRLAGVKIDAPDPLAVLHHGKSREAARALECASRRSALAPQHEIIGPENTVAVTAPMQGTIVSMDVPEGDAVRARPAAPGHGSDEDGARDPRAQQRNRAADHRGQGDTVFEGHPLVFIEEADVDAGADRRRRGGRPRSHPPRPGGGDGAPRDRAGRGAARGGRAPAQDAASAPRARMSRTCATRAASSSTVRWWSRRSAAAAPSRT